MFPFFRFAFMEFNTAEEAAYAVNAMHGVPLDSKHTFHLNYFTDIEKYAELDETFVEPEPEVYQPKVCEFVPISPPLESNFESFD